MGKKAPKTPDPVALSNAQANLNERTSTTQARLAMTGQDNAFGSTNYVTDPSSPSGYRAVQSLSPTSQTAFNNVGNALATPFDMNAGRATELTDINRTLMDPLWDQREGSLNTDLMNRGLREGSEGWATARRNFDETRDDAYSRMHLAAYGTANNAALTERNQPMTEMGALFGMRPNMTTPTPGVAPTDLTTPTMQSFGIRQNAHNQNMAGMYGLGASALGGWAGSAAGSAAINTGLSTAASYLPLLFSDRRLKTDIARIAEDARGWGVYAFRYLWDTATAAWRYGFMADEVGAARPDAVTTHPSGYQMIDYGALA